MKNIHLIESKEKSTLLYNPRHKSFCIRKEPDGMWINDGKVSGADFWSVEKAMNNGFYPYNIYITSDEEIKEGGWVIQVNFEKTNTQLIKCVTKFQAKIANDKNGSYTKNKIILTTDQDLIKDGVQAIDDEFLEWFVKNPNCEEVKYVGDDCYREIIIPQEKPKMTECYFIPSNNTSSATICGNCGQEKFFHTIGKGVKTSKLVVIKQEEPKQETLEEVAYNYASKKLQRPITIYTSLDANVAEYVGFIKGAKWQAERIPSIIEEYLETAFISKEQGYMNPQKWFEQFKKK